MPYWKSIRLVVAFSLLIGASGCIPEDESSGTSQDYLGEPIGAYGAMLGSDGGDWHSVMFHGGHTTRMTFVVMPGESYRVRIKEAVSSTLRLFGWDPLPNGEGQWHFSCPAEGPACFPSKPLILRPGIGDNFGWYGITLERTAPSVSHYGWLLYDD